MVLGGWMDGWIDGWVDGWMGGWMGGIAGLRIACRNQKVLTIRIILHYKFQLKTFILNTK